MEVVDNELEALQLQIGQISNDSLESTRRMKKLCEESKEYGIKTLVALDDQGEQLDKIEKGMDSIRYDMRAAEKALKGMDLCCGIFPKFWKKSGLIQDDAVWNEENSTNCGAPQNFTEVQTGNFVAKVTNDQLEEEMEENMQQVSTIIGNLKNMAADISLEVDRQNTQIARLETKGCANNETISTAINNAKTLNKK